MCVFAEMNVTSKPLDMVQEEAFELPDDLNIDEGSGKDEEEEAAEDEEEAEEEGAGGDQKEKVF